MRFFTKLTFLFNCCFIVAAILRLIEMAKRTGGNLDAAIPLPALEGLLVTLGYSAIFLNIIFVFVYLLRLVRRKNSFGLRGLIIFNLLMFPLQVWYFFFSNF